MLPMQPLIESAHRVGTYWVGPYQADLLDCIISEGDIDYQYALVVKDAEDIPLLIVTSEYPYTGFPGDSGLTFFGAFHPEGHHNFGPDEFKNSSEFLDRALIKAAELLSKYGRRFSIQAALLRRLREVDFEVPPSSPPLQPQPKGHTMQPIEQLLRDAIVDVAKREDDELLDMGVESGIFFMPELAFAYQVGKSLVQSGEEIKWNREQSLAPGGITDLILDVPGDDRRIAIEFKVCSDQDGFSNDFTKLRALNPDRYRCFFCALIDVFKQDASGDGRVTLLSNECDQQHLRQIGELVFLPSRQVGRYVTPVHCLVGLWEVL